MPVHGVSVATYNIHAGVDGWGRPFDAVKACARLDTDVIVMQEDWAPDGALAIGEQVAKELGYTLSTVTQARGWMHPVPADAGPGFGPGSLSRRRVGLRLDSSLANRSRRMRRGVREPLPAGSRRGEWRLSILSRLPVLATRSVELERLRRDPARRHALFADLDGGGSRLTVIGVHMSHLTQGSLVQWAQLRRQLPLGDGPALVAGDMNLWGPPLRLLLPGWRGTARGRTWPSWRPLAQTDHILINEELAYENGELLALGGSDHLAVRLRVFPRTQPAITCSPAER
jgi:endonuclease/exonuclease/phosphatase family metal-dependent hydrolase